MLVLSAEWYVFERFILSCRSFIYIYIYIYIRKRSEARADPCGTPLNNSLTGDTLFSILINCLFSLEVRAEPFIFYAPYAIVVEFSWWYIVIDCIKSCF